MKYANMYLFMVLSLAHVVFGAEKNEKTPLLQPKKDALAQCIRDHDKNGLSQLLTDHPSFPIPENLIQLAHRKEEYRKKKCCSNLLPALGFTACTLYSATLAWITYSPDSRFTGIGLWISSAGSAGTGGYYGVQTGKDWRSYFGSKSIVTMLEEHNKNLKNP